MLHAIGLREPMALGYIFLGIWSFMSQNVLAQCIVYGFGCSSAGAILVLSLPFVIAFLDAGSTPIQCFIVILAFRAVVSNGHRHGRYFYKDNQKHPPQAGHVMGRDILRITRYLFSLPRRLVDLPSDVPTLLDTVELDGPLILDDPQIGNWVATFISSCTWSSSRASGLKEMPLERGNLPEIEEKCQTTRLGMFLAITF
ncbi:hypothetical protein BJ912DRAFT_1120006 [Pholiota molesta]|nr:hypothetical protein BJ912DRAFT_1120006 [Pholiota molesta]